jgi:hypothetical protein
MKNTEIKKLLLSVLAAGLWVACTESGSSSAKAEEGITFEIADQKVEAACGQCKLGLKGSGCDLAVRIDGKAYFVDGTKIDEHGDAHADDGFCKAIRSAKVSGKVENGRFIVTSFKLLPVEK